MISSSSPLIASRLMAGSGIDAVETRVKQLEGMLQAVEEAEKPAKTFSAYLSPTSPNLDPTRGPGDVIFGTTELPGSLKARFDAFQPLVAKYSEQYGVDKNLVNALIRQESGFNPAAVSAAGAKGLMQLMPGTAKSLGVTDLHNPEQNLSAGVRHLRALLDTYHGNIPLALAAYNAGAGAVAKYKGIPPYKETQNYVRNILSMFLSQKQLEQRS